MLTPELSHPSPRRILRWLICLSACLMLAIWGGTLLIEHESAKTPRVETVQQTLIERIDNKATVTPEKQKLKVMSWNTFMLPLPVGYAHDPACRAKGITAQLQQENADIIALTSTFNRIHIKGLTETMRSTHPHQLAHLPDASGKRKVNGGITLLSRYPIERHTTHTFKDCFGADCLTNKGFVHALIRTGSNQKVNIIATHLQALPSPPSDLARQKQLEAIRAYADKNKDIQQWPTLLVGDLNVNGIRHSTFKLPPKTDELSGYGEALKALGNTCVECKNDSCKKSCNAYPKDAMRELQGKWQFTPTATAKLNSVNCIGPTLTQCIDFNKLRYWVGRMRLDYILEWAPPSSKRTAHVTKAYFEDAPSARCEGKYLSDHKALIAHVELN